MTTPDTNPEALLALAEEIGSVGPEEVVHNISAHYALCDRAAAALLACAETARKLEVAERALLHHGYRKSCDIPACNCGDQWLHGGNAAQRLSEIGGVLRDEGLTQGKTILNAVKELLATRAQGEKE